MALHRVITEGATRRAGEAVNMGIVQGESHANGGIESWIGRVKGNVRTIKLCTEGHPREPLGMIHPGWSWLLGWSAPLPSRFRVDQEGRTGTERVRGENSHKAACMSGERIRWQPLKLMGHEVGEFEPSLYDGIWLGWRTKTDEDLVGTLQVSSGPDAT